MVVAVDPAVHSALFRLVKGHGLTKVGPLARDMRAMPCHEGEVQVSEFAAPDGTVAARKVVALGETQCWLRADLAEQAQAALHEEQAESARVAAEVVAWSLGRDQDRAAEMGLSLEEYRRTRNFQLQRIDQKRGRSSIGMG